MYQVYYLESHAFFSLFYTHAYHLNKNKNKKNDLARDSLEDIKRIRRRADNHTRDLGMPMQLLDILLSLVDEQQLGWDGGDVFVCGRCDGCLVLIGLDGQVPQGELVVRARGGKDGSVGGVPFDGCYRGSMPLELSDGGWCAKRGARV